jgi:hypothetical protein
MRKHPAPIVLAIVSYLLWESCFRCASAQVEGITLRTPPITHAFIDGGDILLGIGLSYANVENPGNRIADIVPDSVTTTEQLGFLAIGLADGLAIGASHNPTEISISGTVLNTDQKKETTLKGTKTYYYLIPTLYRWQKNRIVLIWGKGRAVIQENKTLEIAREEYEIGTTGLVGEFFLGESFSMVPWMSWPYLLFDVNPPSVAEIQTPDYGFDAILHMGDVKISLSLIFHALDTVDESTSDQDNSNNDEQDSDTQNDSSQTSYAISLSFRF